MKKRLLTSLMILAVVTAISVFMQPVYAAECVVDGVTVKTSILNGNDCAGTGGQSSVTAMLLYILNFLAMGVGIVVVIGIVWGGFVYAQSDGDASKAKEGTQIIVNAVIGLLLFIFMYAAVNFFVPGGLFS